MITLNSSIDGYSLANIKKIDYSQSIVVFDLMQEVINPDDESISYNKEYNRYLSISEFPYDLITLTQEELDNIKIVNDTLSQAKERKTIEIEQAFNNTIANGYYSPTLDITIRIADDDRNQFNQRITLLNLLPEENRPATTTIKDINNNLIELTLAQFYELMINMGIHYDTYIWGKKSALDLSIKNATTIEEVNAVSWE